ncbi:MAG: DUF1553 domain-containing protein, partial [Akkermansiaceae bacterium]|nr:DUF1553 domain-containing protein [Akkermansiaceae bacterium]
ARHWLDVARYADTKGYDFKEGRRFPYAFTYRDWVIKAFNDDLPYDEFLRRQVAADLMHLPGTELPALGFLTTGRRFLGRNDLIIADRIDVVFRGAMALTMQCARCHDHKDDPLTMADYYGVYGVFASNREPQDLPLVEEPADTPGYRAFLADLAKRANAVHDFAAEKIPDYKRPEHPLEFDRNAAKRKLNQTQRGEYEGLLARMTELEANSPHAPARAMVVRENPRPHQPVIFERGNPNARGAAVPRAFPARFRRDPGDVFQEGSGRLELARDLTRRSNPLTARVWANRVWMHVMGTPLVSSPGDFGVQTPEPLQRELLDHLAVFLVDHGWSTKALIRHIMTSEAWRRSSRARPADLRADPENRYYARGHRHRKPLEAWRDTTLQVSGRLDRALGGRPVRIHARPFPPRRTIYGLVERQNLPSFFRVFDFPESNQPTVRRVETTTPNQALYLMNSPFLHGEAVAAVAAAGIREGDAPQAGRIDALYQRIFQRAPDPGERRRAERFLATATPAGQTAGAWRYGHGRYRADDRRVDFTPLPHFTGTSWQGGPALPDAGTGWVHWTASGGHPGHGDHAAILRWTSPVSGSISIRGKVARPGEPGDGIRAMIVADGEILAEWTVGPGGSQQARVDHLEVPAGGHLDFIVESKGDENSDSFQWAPVIRRDGGDLPLAEAGPGFSGPALEPWARLAQVLLLSNEFMFVD